MQVISIEHEEAKQEAVSTLKNGGIVIYPTETCYGVGVDSTNTQAVTKLLNYKKRLAGKAISIGCSSYQMAEKYVDINPTARNIYRQFLPGPITVISKSLNKVDQRLEAENGTLGVRIPNYPFLLEIIESFRKPITTTSANSYGKKTPYTIDDIMVNITESQKQLIDLIIDAGTLPRKAPSTVIDTTTEELKTYRSGGITFEAENKKNEKIISNSVEETVEVGSTIIRDFAAYISDQPLIILLKGDLGTGKTQLTKGIAKALNITQVLKSPTYTYVEEYEFTTNEFSGMLYHIDAWRIQSVEDLKLLGFTTWVKPGNILVIEWPEIMLHLDEQINNLFEQSKVVQVELSDIGGEKRKINIYS